MYIPNLKNIQNTLAIFYTYPELDNKLIRELFEKINNNQIAIIKKAVKEEAYKRGVKTFGSSKINTKLAFEVWGIDINQLEKNYKKLQELALHSLNA